MHYHYRTRGTCSTDIDFTLTEEGKLKNVCFTGGCNGNLKAIGRLVEGMDAQQVISLLSGNLCGHKSTSCADQLAAALKEALAKSACEEGELSKSRT